MALAFFSVIFWFIPLVQFEDWKNDVVDVCSLEVADRSPKRQEPTVLEVHKTPKTGLEVKVRDRSNSQTVTVRITTSPVQVQARHFFCLLSSLYPHLSFLLWSNTQQAAKRPDEIQIQRTERRKDYRTRITLCMETLDTALWSRVCCLSVLWTHSFLLTSKITLKRKSNNKLASHNMRSCGWPP